MPNVLKLARVIASCEVICVAEVQISIEDALSVSIGTTMVSPAEITEPWLLLRKNEFDIFFAVITKPLALMI